MDEPITPGVVQVERHSMQAFALPAAVAEAARVTSCAHAFPSRWDDGTEEGCLGCRRIMTPEGWVESESWTANAIAAGVLT